jgi:hypothetical protein
MTSRPTTETDFPALQALHRHVGWPERSLEGWRWLHANPARLSAGAPAGWVVDGPDGRPAAHVGNLVQQFWLKDQPMHGATGFSIIVTPPVRGASKAMLAAFAGQPGISAINRDMLNSGRPCAPKAGCWLTGARKPSAGVWPIRT